MAITYGFFNSSGGDRTYNADQMSEYFNGLISDGVYESVGNALVVKAGTGMQVKVDTGRAVIDCKWLKNDAVTTLSINSSHATLNRYSAVVVRLDVSNRKMELAVKDGSNASTPLKPSLTNTTSVKEICLAYVYVRKGATSISQSDIIDNRADTSTCGWVTGLIKQVDTSDLFLQWQTAYEEFYDKSTSDFDEWFSTLTSKLQVNTYIQKYHKVEELTGKKGIFPLDMSGYSYESSDMLFINVNGILLTETYDYMINTGTSPTRIETKADLEAGNVIEITALKSKIGQS